MKKGFDGIVMFSGGLDSTIAVHLLKSQGLSLLALHYVLPFYSGIGKTHQNIRDYAVNIGVTLRIVEEGEAFFAMVRSPQFGFGKNANPCIDCRIHRLMNAYTVMEEVGASFIATGEVIGQRPKSQRRSCLHIIEKRAGLKGKLIRPLSAQLLSPTEVELNGLVDRNRLLAISGRGRYAQLEYAKKHGLQHASPAGGCLLTTVASAKRYLSLEKKYQSIDLEDFKLIAYGRHFALNDSCRLVVARDDNENNILEKIVSGDDLIFDLAEIPGPMGVGRGDFSDTDIAVAASFVARYSRARTLDSVNVKVKRLSGDEKIIAVAPASPVQCEKCRM